MLSSMFSRYGKLQPLAAEIGWWVWTLE